MVAHLPRRGPRSANVRASRFDWQQSFEQAGLALAYTSADGNLVLKANDAFANLHGYAPAALAGTPLQNLVTRRSRATAAAHMRNAGTQAHYVYKTRHIHSDGTAFAATISVTPIRDEAGKALYRTICVQHASAPKPTRLRRRAQPPASSAAAGAATSQVEPFASEPQSHPITETGGDAFWIAGPNRESLRYLNAAFDDVWGRPRKGFDHAQWLNSIVPDDRELAASAFLQPAAADGPISVIYRILRPDGAVRHIKDRGITMRDSNGNVASMMGIASDITQRVDAALSLREAYEFNRQVVANAQEGMIVLDVDARCVIWNPFMERFTGETLQDVFGRQLQEVIPALQDAGFESMFRRALAGEVLITSDLPYDPSDAGARHWCVFRFAPQYNAQGQPTGVIGTVQDITTRKQIEADLRASEARYRNLVERASDVIYETDPSGRFTYFNIRAANRLFGYSEQELHGMSYLELVHPNFRETVAAHYRRQFDQKIPSTYHEFPVLAKDGHVVWVGQNVTLLMEGTRVLRHIAVARDITERKNINERRRQNRIEMEDLQDWSVALQTAIALAHELNQPLNAVCSYNEAALRLLNSGNPYPDKLSHALRSSAQQAERAGKVMRDLLVFLDRGSLPLPVQPTDINGIVREVLSEMENDAHAAAITLLPRLCPDLRPALTHRLHIEKVLGNLLRNSVEAIRSSNRADGAITVHTDHGQDCVLVTVHDNGPGFTEAQAARMLEPFHTSKITGVGMGLPVSRALIEIHGGKLWVESGDGATVRFTVPSAA